MPCSNRHRPRGPADNDGKLEVFIEQFRNSRIEETSERTRATFSGDGRVIWINERGIWGV